MNDDLCIYECMSSNYFQKVSAIKVYWLLRFFFKDTHENIQHHQPVLWQQVIIKRKHAGGTTTHWLTLLCNISHRLNSWLFWIEFAPFSLCTCGFSLLWFGSTDKTGVNLVDSTSYECLTTKDKLTHHGAPEIP